MSYLLSRRHEQRCKREAQISKVIQLLFSIRALIISVVTYKSREYVRDRNAWTSNKDVIKSTYNKIWQSTCSINRSPYIISLPTPINHLQISSYHTGLPLLHIYNIIVSHIRKWILDNYSVDLILDLYVRYVSNMCTVWLRLD